MREPLSLVRGEDRGATTMTDPDRVQRMRTAVITAAVFLAVGAGAYALFQMFRGAAEAPRISRVPDPLPVPEYDFAYASDKDGDFDIYLATLDGSLELALTDHPGGEYQPAWSPDGKLIAYLLCEPPGEYPCRVWVTAVTESDAFPLTAKQDAPQDPAWAPNGTRLAYANNTMTSVVEVVNVDGSGRQRLTDESASSGFPSWSPDGTQIAYASHVPAVEDSDIWIMDASGTGKKALTNLPGNESSPVWSPDGRHIAFTGGPRSGLTQIYLLNVEDGTVRAVTKDPVGKSNLSWSPDGRQILYSASRENSNLYVVTVEGQSQQKVVTGPADDEFPSWNPVAASSK
jgi:Tol biopolymer transport system component